LLDDAAAKAPTPMMRMTYNAQRCNVYAFLGVPLELVPAIQKSAQELPAEYDPRIRLGGLYLKADRLTEATKWTDEALGMASGLPKAAALNQRARIAAQQHDKAGEKRYRQDLVTLLESLPPGQANPELLARAKQMLAATVDTR
jgi:hypothetical protein